MRTYHHLSRECLGTNPHVRRGSAQCLSTHPPRQRSMPPCTCAEAALNASLSHVHTFYPCCCMYISTPISRVLRRSSSHALRQRSINAYLSHVHTFSSRLARLYLPLSMRRGSAQCLPALRPAPLCGLRVRLPSSVAPVFVAGCLF